MRNPSDDALIRQLAAGLRPVQRLPAPWAWEFIGVVLTATKAGLAAAAADAAHALARAAAVLRVVALSRVFSLRALAPVLALLVGAVAAPALAADRPVVVELFTSQGCSSCPPADEIVNELARTRRDVLPLSFHVDYWNRLGWVDPYSSVEATERQRVYVSHQADPTLFTPEMVVDGTRSIIGSDPDQVDAAIDKAEDEVLTLAAVTLKATSTDLVVTVGAGTGRADIVLVGFDRTHTTPIGRGENGGRTLTESNVVRSIQSIGGWNGGAVTLRPKRPNGQLFAVLLAAPDGRIVGLATPSR